MEHPDPSRWDSPAVEETPHESGVREMVEFYERVERIYVAAHGSPYRTPLGGQTNSTNRLATR